MRTVILTGFTSGLGLEMYRALVKKAGSDLNLVCIGRDLSRIQFKKDVLYYEADMSLPQSWVSLIAQIDAMSNSIYFISNASIIEPIAPVGAIDQEQFLSANYVNFVNPAMLVNQLVSMCKRSELELNVVNISTGAAINAIAGWSAYCSSKAAFKMFLDVLVKDGDAVISVEHIDPGVMDTKMQNVIRSKVPSEMKDVNYFKSLHSNGVLKSAFDASSDILSRIGLM